MGEALERTSVLGCRDGDWFNGTWFTTGGNGTPPVVMVLPLVPPVVAIGTTWRSNIQPHGGWGLAW